MGFTEDDGAVLRDDEDAGEGKSPACFGGGLVVEAGVVEGDVDKDGLEVAAMLGRNGVGDAEAFRYLGAGVAEHGEVEGVLADGEVVLARGLG